MASLALSIGSMSFLNRHEELIVPSWPLESITTLMALARLNAANIANKAAVIDVCTRMTNTDNIAGRSHVEAGSTANGSIEVAAHLDIGERTYADSCVLHTGYVGRECAPTDCCVAAATRIAKERTITDSGV